MNDTEILKKKIYMQAKRRGMLEADIIFGHIVDKELNNFSDEELEIFSRLLDINDTHLLEWVGAKKAPSPFTQFWNDRINPVFK